MMNVSKRSGLTNAGDGNRNRPLYLVALLLVQVGIVASAAAQVWDPLPNMPRSRYQHVAASGVLSSGHERVFFFGGIVYNLQFTAVDAYEPGGTWDLPATYPDMPISRMRPAVATDSHGKIYVIGGTGSSLAALASIDVFDPAAPGSSAWSTIPDMPTARHSAGATFAPDGNLYVVGGRGAPGGSGYNVVERYDGTSWTTLPPLPMPLPGVGGAPVGVEIGCDEQLIVVSNSWPGGGPCTSHTYAYDLNGSGGWTTKAPMPGCLGGRGLVKASNDAIYAVNDGDYYATYPGDTAVYSYDSASDIWSVESDTAAGHNDLAVAALGNRIYASAGTSKFGANPGLRFESLVTGTISICDAWEYSATGKDIGVGADGTAWKIGTVSRGSSGYDIAKYVNGSWVGISGGAVRIDGGPSGEAWVVNAQGRIYTYSSGWYSIPGWATDIGVGANGDVWKIGTNYSYPYGYDIAKWDPVSNSWVGIGGRAVRIDVDSDGNPWVVNGLGNIYKYTQIPGFWQAIPGKATDIGVGADDTAWKTGASPPPASIYGFEISKWNEGSMVWEVLAEGEAEEISVGPDGKPWVVNLRDNVYRRH